MLEKKIEIIDSLGLAQLFFSAEPAVTTVTVTRRGGGGQGVVTEVRRCGIKKTFPLNESHSPMRVDMT